MKLPSDAKIEVLLDQIKGALVQCEGVKNANTPAMRAKFALEDLVKELEPLKGPVWRRLIVVQVSPTRYIVAEPAVADWEFKAVTKPLDFDDAHKIIDELAKPEAERAGWVVLALLPMPLK